MKHWLGLAALLTLVLWVAGSTLPMVRYQRGADEGYYQTYASRIAREGPEVFPQLFQEYLHSDPVNRYFPSPMRLTPLLLAGLVFRGFGRSDFLLLSLLSLAGFLFLVGVTYRGVLRMRDERTAFWTSLLVGTAPLHLAMARRALTDTLSSALLVICLWVLLETLMQPNPSKRRWWGIAALYTLTLLTKASAYLLVPVSLFFLGAHALRRNRRPGLLPVLAVSLIPLTAALSACLEAAGGWTVLKETLRFGQGAYTSGFAQLYLQGPWSRYLVDFILISPWPVLFYLIWLGVLMGGKVQDERAWFWALIPILFLAGAAIFPLRNARYAMVLEVPIRMATVLLAGHWVGNGGSSSWRRNLVRLAMLALVFADLQTFSRFVQIDLYETPTHTFLRLSRILVG